MLTRAGARGPARFSDFEAIAAEIGDGVPNAEQYQALSGLILTHPDAAAFAALDPFSAEYRARMMDFYLLLRGKPGTVYEPERDEAANTPIPADLWRGVPPWSFAAPKFVAEFLTCWAQIFRLIEGGQSVVEYGAGTGQALLMLARSGLTTHAADIEPSALETIRRQSDAMGLGVACEQARFGEGFGETRFDRILFFESFHHAFEFEKLLTRLHERLNPGGRVILCGEPIVDAGFAGIPYPWGPRLDALSVFCIRRYGWMELGFTTQFFREAARRTGWNATFHPVADCGRANAYVLEPLGAETPEPAKPQPEISWLRKLVRRPG